MKGERQTCGAAFGMSAFSILPHAFVLIAALCGSGGVALIEESLRGLLPSAIAWE